MKLRHLSLSLLLSLPLIASAQETGRMQSQASTLARQSALSSNQLPFTHPAATKQLFNHLDLSVLAGTTGLGIDLSTPLSDNVRLRAGFEAMPSFKTQITFPIQVGDDAAVSASKFERLSQLLEQFTGMKVDNKVKTWAEPTYYNCKLLVDVYPFVDKRWHITGGFYFGPSQIGKAYNFTEDMPSLMSVQIYNNFYDKIMAGYYWEHDFIDGMSSVDPEMLIMLEDAFSYYGRMGVYLGTFSHDIGPLRNEDGTPRLDADGNQMYEHRKGDSYFVTPDDDCMVKAKMKVNSFKPYLGFGYGSDFTKNKNGWGVSFDAGVMFWGGTPHVVAHDGIDFAHDVDLTHSKVRDLTNIAKQFKVFPVINFRLTKALF